MLLWKDLKSNLASYAGDGSCDPAFVAKELNKAIRRLMLSEQWQAVSTTMRMAVIDSVFPLPYNVETILGCAIDGRPAHIYGTEYQFVSGGPGDLDSWDTGSAPGGLLSAGPAANGLHDMGDGHATMFDIPLDREGYVLAAFCTAPADVGRTLRVQGVGVKNEEVREDIPVTRWEGGVEGEVAGNWGGLVKTSAKNFRGVGRVILPDPTFAGYVSLYAIYPPTNEMFFLAKYHPSQRIPQFRRYRFTTDLEHTAGCAIVLARVKLRFVPCVDDYDVVPFESEEAIQYMMMAANAEKVNPQAGASYEALALRLLGDVEASKNTYRGMPVIVGSNPVTSLGRNMSPLVPFGPGGWGRF